ncbi:MAG TPA: hypothetical protein PKI19_04170 [Elusimicrobiales bacterium]|nr:hypothetical protein [Elusimicrobiales bacterium]
MRIKLLSCAALACAFYCAGFCAGAQGGDKAAGERGQAVAVSFVKQVIVPVSVTAAVNGRDAANAGVKLLWQVKRRFPARQAPDPALVRVYLKTELRLNNSWLDTPGGVKSCPAQKDFERFAAAGRDEIKKYADRLGKEHVWGPTDDAAVQNLLRNELKKGIRTLPAYRGKGVPACAALTPEEEALLQAPAAP